MSNMQKFLFLVILALNLTGCMPYKYCPCAFSTTLEEKEAAHSWLYNVVPRHRAQIRWYDLGHWCTWALFGNDDDGLFGEAATAQFRMDSPPNLNRALAWQLRNPLHNFCFYVIGQAYCSQTSFTLLKISRHSSEFLCYHPISDTVFADEASCFYLALHGWKPFISLRFKYTDSYRGDFYLGWRERGNFGIKCQPLKRSSVEISQEIEKPSAATQEV